MSELFLDKMGIFHRKHRRALLRRILEYDMSNGKRIHTKKAHATQGTYNKTQQMDILLDDPERCKILKRQGLDMNYAWRHRDKC